MFTNEKMILGNLNIRNWKIGIHMFDFKLTQMFFLTGTMNMSAIITILYLRWHLKSPPTDTDHLCSDTQYNVSIRYMFLNDCGKYSSDVLWWSHMLYNITSTIEPESSFCSAWLPPICWFMLKDSSRCKVHSQGHSPMDIQVKGQIGHPGMSTDVIGHWWMIKVNGYDFTVICLKSEVKWLG